MTQYAKLRNFIGSSADVRNLPVAALRESVQTLGAAMKRGKHVGRVGLRVTDARRVRHYCIDILGGECTVKEVNAEGAKFAIACTKDTWAQIAVGELSPVDAFYQGRMEVEGDLAFGKRLYANAASRRGNTDFDA